MIAAADLAPDTILVNGKVVTVGPRFTVAQAVAVKSMEMDLTIPWWAGGWCTRRGAEGRIDDCRLVICD